MLPVIFLSSHRPDYFQKGLVVKNFQDAAGAALAGAAKSSQRRLIEMQSALCGTCAKIFAPNFGRNSVRFGWLALNT
jgi:hypothetical protein